MSRKPEPTQGPVPPQHTDVQSDMDESLWEVFGVLRDVPVAPEFENRLKTRLATDRGMGRAAKWWPILVVLMAGLLAVVIFDRQPDPESGPTPAAKENQTPVEWIQSLSDDDVLALEIDQLETVNQDWFGG